MFNVRVKQDANHVDVHVTRPTCNAQAFAGAVIVQTQLKKVMNVTLMMLMKMTLMMNNKQTEWLRDIPKDFYETKCQFASENKKRCHC